MYNPFAATRRVRYFTPSEANALLPAVSARLEELTRCVRRYREVIHTLRAGGVRNEQRLAVEADELRRESQEILDEINDLGIEVRGIEHPRLDFPALRNGREATLTWRRGEPRVRWWRPPSEGGGRLEEVDYSDLSIWEWCS